MTLHAPEDAYALYPAGAPSILGMPYAAVSCTTSAVVGSTKAPVEDATVALAHLSRPPDVAAETAAALELKSKIECVWEPFSEWRSGPVCECTFGPSMPCSVWYQSMLLTACMILVPYTRRLWRPNGTPQVAPARSFYFTADMVKYSKSL